ncbi:hypothetical protein HK413_06475 [Mucilaginibacter sp. S1162]|uniref:Glycoside hydrolase family 38 N-terminal domain-containing protein n=1 Tax=Mucilaginibacter humi TaxID=2732510 RepID=A0ABX1W1Q5_9SPHI|nr:hypothetical protein [Mucilaginibacter humi]NNU33878.1 hypothetical protein [Mucilaginibacter humi]
MVEPAKDNWRVYVLPHSHVDIGYTNVQAKVLKLHMDNIDESIELAKKTANYPKEAQFKWTTEAMWVVENYLKQADAAKKERFWSAVKKGWISLGWCLWQYQYQYDRFKATDDDVCRIAKAG